MGTGAGAIEQEIEENLSDPWYSLMEHIDEDMFAGSPYAQDSLGKKAYFDATTAQMLQKFHDAWYTPNNMILVVVGDVNPRRHARAD
jgi:zinc protease